MKQSVFLLAILLIFTITSCKEDGKNAKANFSVKQKNTTLKSTNSGTFTFTKALIGISEIDLEIEVGATEREIEFEGAYQFNILAGTSTPVISPMEIEPGAYHELEINVDNVLASGKSIEIAGKYDNGNIYQFEFSSNLNEDYDIVDENGITAASGETINFVLYLNIEALFSGVDFGAAVVDNDNIIRINSDSNSNLASIIENNFDNIMDFDAD